MGTAVRGDDREKTETVTKVVVAEVAEAAAAAAEDDKIAVEAV